MKSITFVVDGTSEGRVAAQVAIMLAQQLKAKIIAHYPIDTKAVFALAGLTEPGLCGSGPFIEAEQTIVNALTTLGQSILLSFAALAEGHGVEVETCTVAGDVSQEVLRNSQNSSMIVLSDNVRNELLATTLRDTTNCPVLVVKSASEACLLQNDATAGSLTAACSS